MQSFIIIIIIILESMSKETLRRSQVSFLVCKVMKTSSFNYPCEHQYWELFIKIIILGQNILTEKHWRF